MSFTTATLYLSAVMAHSPFDEAVPDPAFPPSISYYTTARDHQTEEEEGLTAGARRGSVIQHSSGSPLSSEKPPGSPSDSVEPAMAPTVDHTTVEIPGNEAAAESADSSSHHADFFTVSAYLRRCLGAGLPGPSWFNFNYDVLLTCVFSMITMTLLATLQYFGLRPYNLGMLSYLPSFGASSTLVYFLYTTPGAQPRALILTHICGAFLGVSWSHIWDGLDPPLYQLLACAFAVAMMTSIMMLTNTFQPSASATTCLAALHSYGQMKDQGYMFLVTPATLGPVIIVFLGWIFNNLVPWRHCYPSWI